VGGPRGGGGDHGLVPDEGKNVRLVHEVNVYDMMMKNVMLVWVRVGRASAASEAASISREHGGWGATIKVIPPPRKTSLTHKASAASEAASISREHGGWESNSTPLEKLH